jgi:hypothetical protein
LHQQIFISTFLFLINKTHGGFLNWGLKGWSVMVMLTVIVAALALRSLEGSFQSFGSCFSLGRDSWSYQVRGQRFDTHHHKNEHFWEDLSPVNREDLLLIEAKHESPGDDWHIE